MHSRREFLKRAGLTAPLGLLPMLQAAGKDLPALAGSFPWEKIRADLLVPSTRTYLNTGSLGPSPRPVMDAIFSAMRQLEANPVAENWGPLGNQMEEVRKKVAHFVNADIDEVVLTRNTTEGLELVCQSLRLRPGDEIITTTLEHGGGEVGLDYLVKYSGAKLLKIEMPLPPGQPDEILSTIKAAITDRTRLIMLSHINTVTGMVMPLEKVSMLTRPRGIFLLVDGAQALGMLPLDLHALGADAYASSGHKWLLGPKETGFLYVRKDQQKDFTPVFTMDGFQTYTRASGTRNVSNFIGLGAAIDYQTALGKEAIQQYWTSLRDHCQRELAKLKGLRMLSPETGPLDSAIVSFSAEKAKNHEIYEKLQARDIVIKVLPQHNGNRISCHVFVSSQDIDKFIEALKPIL